jgi:serine/threonine protein kinase
VQKEETGIAVARTVEKADQGMDSSKKKKFVVQDLPPGEILQNRFVIQSKIGVGGMGVVYAARDRHLPGRKVAIKTVNELSDAAVRRFGTEAILTAQIRSENVIKVHDFWTAPTGVPFLALEFLSGKTLRELLGDEKLAPARAVFLILGACQGIAAAHAVRIYHRDLTAKNIYVVDNGGFEQAKVIDFGAAGGADVSRLTEPGQMIGTTEYMAPERLEGDPGGAKGDQYSLGLVLYEALAGRLPFARGMTVMDTIVAVAKGDFPRIESFRPDLPSGLAEVVHKAIARDPNDRFPSVHAFGRELLPFGGHKAEAMHEEFFLGAPPVEKRAAELTGDTTLVQRIIAVQRASGLSEMPTVPHEYDWGAHTAETVERDLEAIARKRREEAEASAQSSETSSSSVGEPATNSAVSASLGTEERAWLKVAEAVSVEVPAPAPPASQQRRWFWLLVLCGALLVGSGGVALVSRSKSGGAVAPAATPAMKELAPANEPPAAPSPAATRPAPETAPMPLAPAGVTPIVPTSVGSQAVGKAAEPTAERPRADGGEGVSTIKPSKKKRLSQKHRADAAPPAPRPAEKTSAPEKVPTVPVLPAPNDRSSGPHFGF